MLLTILTLSQLIHMSGDQRGFGEGNYWRRQYFKEIHLSQTFKRNKILQQITLRRRTYDMVKSIFWRKELGQEMEFPSPF